MSEPNLKQLQEKDFNPDKYVRELSQHCVGGQELQRMRKQIQGLSEKTSASLKKNVYQNYMQFIDTAKEISHLESEMYQLSHLLSEQRLLLSGLADTALLADETPAVQEKEESNDSQQNNEDQENVARKRKLATILEKVEGCSDLLEVPGRALLYDDDLLEIDPIENSPVQRVHGYLLSDGFMLAKWISDRRGPMRYKFEVIYDLGSLAVVNVRDLGPIKLAFKILAFPDTRVFQCSSSSAKKDWLSHFDQAKKARLTQDTIKRENIAERSPSRTISVDSPSYNPFDETPEEDVFQHPEWFVEVPEDLDVYVAQRHFEEALNLLNRAREYITQHITKAEYQDPVLNEIQRKVELRHATLTETLMRELEVNPDKSLQGGLRAARRAVRLLNQLGRSTQACDLFLQLCSSILKTQCKRVKREGSTIVYVKHLSSVVFTNMCHMAEEFLRAFPDSPPCAAVFVVWAESEISIFTSHLIKQVFIPQITLSTLTECIVTVRVQCDRLCHYGVDLVYQLDGALRNPLSRALRDTRDKLTDAVKIRAQDDKWIPMNLVSKQKLARCLQEHLDMGVKIDDYVTGGCWLELTGNTIAFIKLYYSLTEDCLKLYTPELLHTIDETLYDVFKAQVKFVENSLINETQNDPRQLMVKNGVFLMGTLLPLIENKYEKVIGFKCTMLARLHTEHGALEKGNVSSNRPITKYSTTEFL